MTKEQVYKSIPIYNDLVALESTIKVIKDLTSQEITKLYITYTNGAQLDLSNFDREFSSSLMLSILEYKKQQLKSLTDKLEKI